MLAALAIAAPGADSLENPRAPGLRRDARVMPRRTDSSGSSRADAGCVFFCFKQGMCGSHLLFRHAPPPPVPTVIKSLTGVEGLLQNSIVSRTPPFFRRAQRAPLRL
jgi:hypothetical protein